MGDFVAIGVADWTDLLATTAEGVDHRLIGTENALVPIPAALQGRQALSQELNPLVPPVARRQSLQPRDLLLNAMGLPYTVAV
jgi:hypothetical protein